MTPKPNNNPISEPVENNLQPNSSLFRYQSIEPINSIRNDKNEHQANETCQNNILYDSAEPSCTESGLIPGAQRNPNKIDTEEPNNPNKIRARDIGL
jgi:hypothetical protein